MQTEVVSKPVLKCPCKRGLRHFILVISLCSACVVGEFVVGRVIRAMSQCWHPNCFKCVSCHIELADIGFVKSQGRYDVQSELFL